MVFWDQGKQVEISIAMKLRAHYIRGLLATTDFGEFLTYCFLCENVKYQCSKDNFIRCVNGYKTLLLPYLKEGI
jgi:hypothetical protein